MLLNTRLPRLRQGGFTLVELLVTILIVTVGLLGLAKMQATAVSNTSVSRTRSLMTFQAESLAGMIRANKGFWVTSGTQSVYPVISVGSDGTVTDSNNLMAKLGSTGSCVDLSSGTCSAANLAWDDIHTWATAYHAAFPNATATIACVPATGVTCGASPTSPHGYDITLTWQQKLVALNKSTVNTNPTQSVSMVMHVQP